MADVFRFRIAAATRDGVSIVDVLDAALPSTMRSPLVEPTMPPVGEDFEECRPE